MGGEERARGRTSAHTNSSPSWEPMAAVAHAATAAGTARPRKSLVAIRHAAESTRPRETMPMASWSEAPPPLETTRICWEVGGQRRPPMRPPPCSR